MTWTIAVPFRSRDEPLSAVGDAARRAFSTDEDRAVARQLVLGAAADGVATVGGLLDKLEKLGPAQRRSLLDLDAVPCAGLQRRAERPEHRAPDLLPHESLVVP